MMDQIIPVIKEQVHMQDVFAKYGLVFKNGALACPFHNEKTPSLRVYRNDTQWHCFGCGADGDVISFIQKYFDLDFSGAIERIDQDFGLGLSGQKPTLRNKLKYDRVLHQRKLKEQEREKLNGQYRILCTEYQSCREVIRLSAPKSIGDEISDIYAEAVKRREWLEYRLDELLKEMR